MTSLSNARDAWLLDTAQLQAMQLAKLNAVLEAVRDRPFYREHLGQVRLPLQSLEELTTLPLLEKHQIVTAGRCLPGRLFDLPRWRYTRLHQTSGTKGFPMVVLDTPEDWGWWLRCWDFVLDAAGVTNQDVALMAFSFGPFIGFWTAHEALVKRGATVVPGGGISSESRLRMIDDHGCTVVCCTPTYALHLGSVAEKIGIDLPATSVSRIIVAGEPGGSVAGIRNQIEAAWGARVVDHTGASEVGAWGFGSADGRGIHVIETEFLAECLQFTEQSPTGTPVDDGQEGELVLTGLGRFGGPAIRYRTGDIVRGWRKHNHEVPFLWLDGGVLGRSDDMLVIRGVNVFPSSIEAIIREVHPLAEFRMTATRENQLDQLAIEIEADEATASRTRELLRQRLAMRIPVTAVTDHSLPRFEAKARRLVDRRGEK